MPPPDKREEGMEKRGVIEPGRTPPEEKDTKEASADQFDHAQSRLADAANEAISDNRNS